MIIYIIIIIIIILLYLICIPDDYNQIEYFNIRDMRVCNGCSYRNKYDCKTCTNCGYCIDQYGNGKCVSGDNYGPYFNSDCFDWTNFDNLTIENPQTSYYINQIPNYRRYYGKNQGRRSNHHVF